MGTIELKSDLRKILDGIEDEQLLRTIYDFLKQGKCENHKVKSLYSFGSVNTTRFTKESDIDLMVDFNTNDPIACRLSFQRGFEGNVSFISKTQLIDHYTETLEALHAGGRLMIIETAAALKLMNRYFKNIEI